MQQFVSIASSEKLTDSRQEILNNDLTVMSCNSGTSFPTTNLEVGMFCLRTDLNQLFQMVDMTPTWKMVFDLSKTATSKEYVDAQNATKVNASDVVAIAAANKILRLDGSGKLPASITGDAATVGGLAPGVGANNVLLLDAGGKVPASNLPVATASAVGAVKPGNGLSVDANGALTVAASGVPAGVICMWSGSAASVPAGWTICDGTNGTPNLKDRFVLGAGGSYAVGATGGEVNHTLTTAEMPSHNHSAASVSSLGGNWGGTATQGRDVSYMIPTNYVGGGGAHNNMPPYYALCYIMKL
jgi:hypothetical protein